MTYSPERKRIFKTSTSRGTSITGLLGVAFIILKLCGVIAWSWLWVLAPFWVPFILVALVILTIVSLAAADGSRRHSVTPVRRHERKRWSTR